MKKALYNASQIVTVSTQGNHVKRGSAMQDIGVLTGYSIIIEDEQILAVVPNEDLANYQIDDIIDVTGMTILPGLIDCHTHTVFAGSRANEFDLKLKGATYEEIAAAGGGIKNTTTATREAKPEQLLTLAMQRIQHFISLGITSLEIKSGYGLDFMSELKIMAVIDLFRRFAPIDIYSSFLGAHIVPAEYKERRSEYIAMLCEQLLPEIQKAGLANYCDVFCEESAFSAAESEYILTKAREAGLYPRMHTEQFHRIGGLETALKLHALSVDHLEVMAPEQITALANSDTVAVVLPGVSFFLKYSYAPARNIIDAGGIVAIATDFNPGSCHIPNLHLVMSLAALHMKLTMEEIISAVTINAAKALGISEKVGSIETGKLADFAIFNTDNYKNIIYTLGMNLNVMTMKKGKFIYPFTTEEKNENH
ncbi:MAG: imidazolonepropionase [Ignavibacteria bacterium]|nr:imidazolonepropionase [Ignavibacteria bacterium]